MKLVDRYLTREYLVPVTYCLFAFGMIFVVIDLFDNIGKFLEAGTPPLTIGRYYLCTLAPVLEFLAPASLLLATLYTLWQLTRNNELIAMRASGISLYRIMLPFLAVGLIASLLSALVKEHVAPRVGLWAEEFRASRFTVPHPPRIYYDRAFFNSTDHRLWHVEEYDMDDPGKLLRVKITQERADRTREKVMVADKAQYLDGEWWFVNLRVQEFDEHDNPLGKLEPVPATPGAAVSIPGMSEEPSMFINEIKPWEMLTATEMATYIRQRPDLSAENYASKRFDLHQRLAMPWACLIVTLFGIPAGAKGGRQSAISGIFMSIGLFFGFYALMQLGMILGKREIVWPWLGAWLSNLVFFVAGLIMLARMK
jgi:lipopolysaccharide export system permease protein